MSPAQIGGMTRPPRDDQHPSKKENRETGCGLSHNGYDDYMNTTQDHTAAIEELKAQAEQAYADIQEASAALAKANQADRRIRRKLTRLQRKAGLITENGNPTSCTWEHMVPSNHPEPDSEADCWKVVQCGETVSDIVDGWACEGGHRHFTYGSDSQINEERQEALVEMIKSGK